MPEVGEPTVVAIVGPTASGKTALSIACARELGGEIIACDSRTVYREFDIGTAKPTLEERAGIKHYAIDVADPTEDYTVAQFTEQGAQAIEQIRGMGKIPIVAGGTGFYSRALLEGLDIPAVAPQPELRAQLKEFADRLGNEALHRRLAEVDAQSAARLNPNDRFRIVRALEVHAVTGVPMSQAAGRKKPPYRTIWIGLTANDRAVLHQAIGKRLQEQMEAGLLAETERLYKRYGPHQKLMHTVNYKQLVQHLEGELNLETALKQAAQHNVQLARRQLIWFRANQAITWYAVDALSRAELTAAVVAHIKDAVVGRDR
jgi:tRNA dimethylallyltransferase